jgi:hypothetical protein
MNRFQTLMCAWFQRLKRKSDEALSNVAFKFYLRRYNLGVLDARTNTFSTIDTTAASVSGSFKYAGAAAVGTRVYFAPYNQEGWCRLTLSQPVLKAPLVSTLET